MCCYAKWTGTLARLVPRCSQVLTEPYVESPATSSLPAAFTVLWRPPPEQLPCDEGERSNSLADGCF